MPINTLDKASMIHDIEYLKKDQFKADNNMWLNIVRENPLLLPVANFARLGLLAKDLVGYKPITDEDEYLQLKNLVKQNYDLGRMKFKN